MKKSDELALSKSCFNKAGDNELMFILLARDVVTPATIRYWIAERIRIGKNKIDDLQITEARDLAKRIEELQTERK